MRFHRDSGIWVMDNADPAALIASPSGRERGGILPSVRIAGADGPV